MSKVNGSKKLYEEIYTTLRKEIIDGKYPGGTFLIEQDLCDRFGVSRTPVREAIIRLAKDQFIELIPNRGAYLPHVSLNDIIEICELRAADEGMAAFRCARNRSAELIAKMDESVKKQEALINSSATPLEISTEDFHFHDLLREACGNRRLIANLTLIDNQMHRFAKSASDDRAAQTTLRASLDFHKRALKAIKEGKALDAQKAMNDHWFTMMDGYISRDLAGMLSPTL